MRWVILIPDGAVTANFGIVQVMTQVFGGRVSSGHWARRTTSILKVKTTGLDTTVIVG